MYSFLKNLSIIFFLALVLNLVGCASDATDPGYTRVGPESISPEEAHGWGDGVPQPSSH